MRKTFKILQAALGYNIEKQQQHLSEWAADWLKRPDASDMVAFWREHSPKYDVWSIGAIATALIYQFMYWPSWKSDQTLAYVVKKMCHLDPRRRIPPHIAIKILSK